MRLRNTGITRALADAAHCDFWRAAPTGRFFLMRGYQEDSQEAVAPGTIIDVTLPIWRLSEGLLHAARMAAALGKIVRLASLFASARSIPGSPAASRVLYKAARTSSKPRPRRATKRCSKRPLLPL
jgi:hypothetical protein